MLIALSVILVLLVILLLRIFLIFEYDSNGVSGYVKLVFLKIKFPTQKKKTTVRKDKKETAQKKPGNLVELKGIIFPAVKTLGKLLRLLSVNLFIADVTLATDDAFNTAMSYGATCAGIGAVFPFLDGKLRIKKKKISINANFESKTGTIYLYANISLRIWQIIILTIYLLYQYIKNVKGFDKNGRTCT